jgi:hypothetical protein
MPIRDDLKAHTEGHVDDQPVDLLIVAALILHNAAHPSA